jgi:hypothetical protein
VQFRVRKWTSNGVLQVFRYMVRYGLPDESCQLYSASDHTKFEGLKECPDMSKCSNCMPLPTPDPDYNANTCWPVETPLLYNVRLCSMLCRSCCTTRRCSDETGAQSARLPWAPSFCATASACCS